MRSKPTATHCGPPCLLLDLPLFLSATIARITTATSVTRCVTTARSQSREGSCHVRSLDCGYTLFVLWLHLSSPITKRKFHFKLIYIYSQLLLKNCPLKGPILSQDLNRLSTITDRTLKSAKADEIRNKPKGEISRGTLLRKCHKSISLQLFLSPEDM